HEQEQNNLLNDYHLSPIFKRQNKTLVNFAPQQRTEKHTDRAQQTIKVNQHGAQTQIQAALITTTASSAPLGQAFGLPPLPEHNPCDNSIARPELWIVHNNTMIRLLWIVPSTSMGSIREYEIYTYQQGVTTTSSDWKKTATVK
ncbi:unnamed protein product, partial [Rotaria sp. Silwood2]